MTDSIARVTKKRKVDVSEIQKSYILSELSKAITDKNKRASFVKKLVGFLDALGISETTDFTRLLSDDYRKNAVYSYTIKTDFEWYEVETPVDKVYLTPTNEKESAILANLSPPWNLKSLVEKVQRGETEGLKDFLDKGLEAIGTSIAIFVMEAEEEKPKIKLIDGIHRTTAMLIRNKADKLNLYLGTNL